LRRTTSYDVKVRAGVLAVGRTLKKETVNMRISECAYFEYMGRRNLLMDYIQILFAYRHPRHNHVYQIW